MKPPSTPLHLGEGRGEGLPPPAPTGAAFAPPHRLALGSLDGDRPYLTHTDSPTAATHLQLPPQHTSPFVQAGQQMPPEHVVAPSQVVPHTPQLSSAEVTSVSQPLLYPPLQSKALRWLAAGHQSRKGCTRGRTLRTEDLQLYVQQRRGFRGKER